MLEPWNHAITRLSIETSNKLWNHEPITLMTSWYHVFLRFGIAKSWNGEVTQFSNPATSESRMHEGADDKIVGAWNDDIVWWWHYGIIYAIIESCTHGTSTTKHEIVKSWNHDIADLWYVIPSCSAGHPQCNAPRTCSLVCKCVWTPWPAGNLLFSNECVLRGMCFSTRLFMTMKARHKKARHQPGASIFLPTESPVMAMKEKRLQSKGVFRA